MAGSSRVQSLVVADAHTTISFGLGCVSEGRRRKGVSAVWLVALEAEILEIPGSSS